MKIKEQMKKVQETFGGSFDVKTREFRIAGKHEAVAFFVDTIAGGQRISLEVLMPLIKLQPKEIPKTKLLEYATKTLVNTCEFILKDTFEEAVTELLMGKCVIVLDDVKQYVVCDTTVMPARGIAEPPTASVVKGPREGFVENLVVNIGLLRKRLKTPDLTFVNNPVGTQSKTNVTVMYIKSIADDSVVEKVIEKIKAINRDGIIDSYYIMQYLENDGFNIFRQVGAEEKPDIIASKLLEGRVAIIVDGSPVVLTVPYILLEDFQAADDYYNNNVVVTLRRFVRLFGAVVAIVLPGLYVAMMLYHYQITPLSALVIITNSLENTPFTPLVEMIFILILFEILYESSLRMPRHLGGAVGLVAALVLGGTAVDAGLVSAPAILIVALSSITTFIVPNLAPQISLLRLFYVLIGGMLGLYGIVLVTVLLVAYLAGLDSFETPFLAPYAPYVKSDQKDALIMKNIKMQDTRPHSYTTKNKTRAKGGGKQ